MKNYRLSTIACLISLCVVGHAVAGDASTNAIPTMLLQRYTGSAAIVADRGTNAIPTALLEQYTGSAVSSPTKIANYFMDLPSSNAVVSRTKVANYFLDLSTFTTISPPTKIAKFVRPDLPVFTTGSIMPVKVAEAKLPCK